MRCSRTRPLPAHERRHDELIWRRERVPGGVSYHCVCRCGERWIIGVMVSADVADLLADPAWISPGYWAAAELRIRRITALRQDDNRTDLDPESHG